MRFVNVDVECVHDVWWGCYILVWLANVVARVETVAVVLVDDIVGWSTCSFSYKIFLLALLIFLLGLLMLSFG